MVIYCYKALIRGRYTTHFVLGDIVLIHCQDLCLDLSRMAPDIDRIGGVVIDPVDPVDERKNVVKRALNQKILVPDILSLMPAWPWVHILRKPIHVYNTRL